MKNLEWFSFPEGNILTRADDGSYYVKEMMSVWFECDEHGVLCNAESEVFVCGRDNVRHRLQQIKARVTVRSNDPKTVLEECDRIREIDPRKMRGRREIVIGRIERHFDE